MGSLFRSEDMTLCQLFIQSEAAYNCISELGELGLAQFRDLNPDVSSFQRKFTSEVRRCDEMDRKLRFLETEIRKEGLRAADVEGNPEAPQPREMTDLESTFEKLEGELREINVNTVTLKKSLFQLTELKHILSKTDFFFDEQESTPLESTTRMVITDNFSSRVNRQVQLGFVVGVIPREKIPPFELMLWRTCRGNVFFRRAEIETPLQDYLDGFPVFKSVFVIFFQGDRLKTKVKKICEGFRASLYPCPESRAERNEMAVGVLTRLEDLNVVLSQTQEHKQRVLLAVARTVKTWSVKVNKIKAIYHTLNLFNLDVTRKCLIGECWVPVLDISTVQMALRRGTDRSGSSAPPILNCMKAESPPTFNRVNKFTSGFQNLVDAYGVGTYREINPAPYTIITFPFLFAVMFGDAGHGIIVTAFGAWMVLREKQLAAKKLTSDVWTILFGGRYIILLMGLFSIYTGTIYNDMFSKSINFFGSSWSVNYNTHNITTNDYLTLDPATPDYAGHPYPFGLDPIWQLADNKINFSNVFKMKISIIFGVLHMLFGVFLSFKNYQFFRNKLDIFATFIPQVLFLSCLFLYLVTLIFVKWVMYSPKSTDLQLQPYCAPSILITFINMVLLKKNESYKGCDPYMFTGQRELQLVLLAVAVICVPWMLFTKPVAMALKRRKNRHTFNVMFTSGEANVEVNRKSYQVAEDVEEEEEPLGEIYIHQGIHTVEYVLGSVSHTASYLRLWALSLAHAELSEVLWTMVLSHALNPNFGYPGAIAIWVIFAFWAILTITILVIMEGLSAFLHTLRLHWVEFQSKFYDGKGQEFQPFSFETILKNTVVE